VQISLVLQCCGCMLLLFLLLHAAAHHVAPAAPDCAAAGCAGTHPVDIVAYGLHLLALVMQPRQCAVCYLVCVCHYLQHSTSA